LRVVKIIDHHAENAQFLFYVMPNYLEQGYISLESVAYGDESPFLGEIRRSLYFIAECADALAQCHKGKVVHRDLKPTNILFHPESLMPLILDFGCCHIEGGAPVTLVDEGVGSVNFMAPECESGTGGEPDARTDVYSLGKLLWVLLTGRRPFAREKPAFTSSSISSLFPDHPECWHASRILLSSVRRNPEERYKSADEMAADCDYFANNVVGRYLPLELTMTRCPACGQGRLVRKNPEFDVPMHMVFGNPMPRGVIGLVCDTCGHVCAWDTRLLSKYKDQLANAE
jgi:serine/threonine protein kinase